MVKAVVVDFVVVALVYDDSGRGAHHASNVMDVIEAQFVVGMHVAVAWEIADQANGRSTQLEE
jgi:hypothetical protein